MYCFKNVKSFGLFTIAFIAMLAACAQAKEKKNWLAMMEKAAAEETSKPVAAKLSEKKWEKLVPITFGIDYTLVSDYVWRGANLSEYAREGRERPNHQVGVSASLDLKKFGTVGVSAWWEWYGGQKAMAPGSDTHLQEVDYAVNWSYDIKDAGVEVELGWIAYTFPNVGNDGYSSYEVYGKLSFDDGKWFGLDEGILNPYIAYYYDVDVVEAGWLEVGVSHEFKLSDDKPVLKDLTVTPSVVLGVDNRYWDKAGGTNHKSTKLGAILYGMEVSYDLSGALDVPEKYGSLNLTGFVNFSDAIREELLNDEFYGGIKIAYEW